MPDKLKIAAMLRIKNEERWIEGCLASISDVVDEIVILDDGSTDRTPEICRGFPKVVRYEYQQEPVVDEVRDKNRLLRWTLDREPDWVLAMDGDEELGAEAGDIISRAIEGVSRHNPEYAVFMFKHIYFWNDFGTIRTDGIYGNIWRRRLFTTWNQDVSSLRFDYSKGHGSGFHCGSVPPGLLGRKRRIPVALKHYGYLDRELREQKYFFYKKNDPASFARGYYDHLINGNARLEKYSEKDCQRELIKSTLCYGSFDPSPGGVHRIALDMCRVAKRVLDVGCGAGHVGRELKARGSYVVGIEPDANSAEEARKVLDGVIEEPAQSFHREELAKTFDAALLLDILEHVKEPLLVLSNLKKYLKKGGFFIISVPNVAHWSVRMDLLLGRFQYESYGILDESHLRFFTLGTILDLIREAGFEVEEVKYAWGLDSRHYRRRVVLPLRRLGLLKALVEKLGPKLPGIFAYQFIIKAS